MSRVVYLDNNATTPCAPEVVAAMWPFFTSSYANASSDHLMGHQAAESVHAARDKVAVALDATPQQLVFTSGATESNNLVILGLAAQTPRRNRVVTTTIEHKSVLAPCERLAAGGFDVVKLPVRRNGVVDLDAVDRLVDERTLLVSVQGANNEIGTIQPVASIAKLAHARGAFVHCDATQLLGKVTLSLRDLGVDYASVSSHKVYGPKGIGVLFIRGEMEKRALSPVLYGGGQESGLRPGTLNVPAVVGFGTACDLLQNLLAAESDRLSVLRQQCEEAVFRELPGSFANGARAPRLPGTTSITIPGVPADMLIANMPEVLISSRSACTSGAPGPSHVLLALGLERELADCTVRISIGRHNTKADIRTATQVITREARKLLSKLGEPNGSD